jgi:hypothetical protein
MTTANSNSITGITTLTASTDVANKEYVDSKSGGSSSTPSQTGNAGEFLTTTDGVTLSWDYVSNYEEFTTTGAQTFTVPSYSNVLLIEAVGAGGGGSAGTSGGSSGTGGGSGSSGGGSSPSGGGGGPGGDDEQHGLAEVACHGGVEVDGENRPASTLLRHRQGRKKPRGPVVTAAPNMTTGVAGLFATGHARTGAIG